MLPLLAALVATSTSPTLLESSVPWWERITVTVDPRGTQQSCRYEASLAPIGIKDCDEETAATVSNGAKGPTGAFSRITYERRFSPGSQLDSGRLSPGDQLLGRQVMFLTFDPAGLIDSCKIVATTGDMSFQYDCDEARKEQFRSQAGNAPLPRQAFMTILAYGHVEQIA